MLDDVDSTLRTLQGQGYFCDRETATTVFLAQKMQRPLLLEGPAGVGKTELARVLATSTDRTLIRLQCHEGLDESRALYEWEYGKQLLYTQLLRPTLDRMLADSDGLEQAVRKLCATDSALFDEHFLLERPLLRALRCKQPALLLIDEVDRADPEFEALLLEMLAEFQVSIPELGTVRAAEPPLVVLTSNATRELGEALRRRCLHRHLDYPSPSMELRILSQHVPEASAVLAGQIVDFVQKLRGAALRKPPSIAESVEWARALVLLGADGLDAGWVRDSLGALLKHREDLEHAVAQLPGEASPPA